MNIWLIGVSLLGILTLTACKPESTAQSPLASPLLSPIEVVSTKSPIPVPTQTAAPRPANMVVHIVQPGDTLLGLALQYHVTVEQIYRLNGLSANPVLSIGQELIIGDQSIVVSTSTPQPTLTATPPPTIVPPISLASSSNQPALSQNLLYLRDGDLFRWNHVTGQQEILAGPGITGQSFSVQPASNRINGPGPRPGSILNYSVSADGRQIVVYRFTAAPDGYELGLLDLTTRQVTAFYEGITLGYGLLAMSVSPDGKYVAWIPQDSVPTTGQGRTSGLAAPARGGGPQTGPIFVASTARLDQNREIGRCGGQQTPDYNWGCQGFLWSPDSQSIAWADGNGVWLTKLEGTPRQLIQTALTMPGGNQVQGVYTLREWSPSGRYVLLSVGHYEGHSLGILDIETVQTAPLPNSFEYAYPGPTVTWMNDDQLFVGRPGRVDIDLQPSLETWSIEASSGLAVTVTHSLALNVSLDNAPIGLIQERTGQLAFALVNRSNTNYRDRGLYLADPRTLTMKKVNGLPPLGHENIGAGGSLFNVEVFWTTDGSGALVSDQDLQQVLYAPTADVLLYDLRPMLGDSAYGFHWVE